jgi:hypothetical protein
VALDRPGAGVALLLAPGLAGGDRLDRRKEHDDMTRTAADHRAVLAEQRPGHDVFERDREAGREVAVRRGGGEPVSEPQLLDRLG